MSHDYHARAVVLLVKNGSSTIDNRVASPPSGSTSSCCTAGAVVGFSTITWNTQSTESPGKECPCVDGEVLRHSMELPLDINLAPICLQGPLSPQSSS